MLASDADNVEGIKGQIASAGFAAGPLVALEIEFGARSEAGTAEEELAALKGALEEVAGELARLMDRQADRTSKEILEFQVALIEDDELIKSALDAIGDGVAADRAWIEAMDAHIEGYAASDNEYFSARAADLKDLRDRVLRALMSQDEVPSALPESAIIYARDLPPSTFLELDWSRCGGIVLAEGSTTSHVALLARGRGVPMLVGINTIKVNAHSTALLDAESGHLMVNPSPQLRAEFEAKRDNWRESQAEADANLYKPAVAADGTRVKTLINVGHIDELRHLNPAACDGIGLFRSEFLFMGRSGLPDEETQLEAYRSLLQWADGRPVTIRTLDAGGDKPVQALTELTAGEVNPFLGTRGIRLSRVRPDVFRTQMRALIRASRFGPLKIMLPMVTKPEELGWAREIRDDICRELSHQGVSYRVPQLGIMVEVPAVALTIEQFGADFFSIGSNDLIQYTLAGDRGLASLKELLDPKHPAVLELIGRVAKFGQRAEREVSLCGDMASEPDLVALLLESGIRVLSVAPAMLAKVKSAVAAHGA